MSGFKLLGIRTGKRVNLEEFPRETDYLRILKENTFYTFYNEFSFSEDNSKVNIEYLPKLPKGLYNIKTPNCKEIEINISAIVGKNGSGKSTLLELIYLAIYNLGCKYELLKKYEKNPEYKEDLGEEKEFIEKNHEPKNLDFNIYYTKDSKIFQLQFFNDEIYLIQSSIEKRIVFSKSIQDVNKVNGEDIKELSEFFYSIAINYSIYGLNSNIMGNWIIPLFHKNDGYKTPIVINPMRKEGNFDINDEMEFAKYRLLNNLLIERYLNNEKGIKKEIFVTDKQYVKTIRFRFTGKDKLSDKIHQADKELGGEPIAIQLIRKLQTTFFNDSFLDEVVLNKKEIPFKLEIFNYIVRKIDKIRHTYKKEYSKIKDTDKLIKRLKEDDSHITFKLKQAINYLRKNLNDKNLLIWSNLLKKDIDEDIFIDFTLDELLKWVGTSDISDFINHLPPSIFSIEILLSGSNHITKIFHSSFDELSSGEQQLIHSVQSVLYHINNIQSIHNNRSNDRVKYKFINVIFDEIELYFHPEYQRKFINELLNSFKRLYLGEKDEGIQGINIIFSTHSPFILSDIPASNVLMLKKGNLEKNNDIKTFGANIHELLGESFFLENGYVGEFVKNKIEKLIDLYRKGDSGDEKYLTRDSKLKEEALDFISLIDDDLISERLKEMHKEKFPEDKLGSVKEENYENWLEEELERIRKK